MSTQVVLAPAQTPAKFQSPLVLVTGGKGGVGKTTVAANLAIELCRNGKRVLLVDLDLALANAAVFLGLSPRVDLGDALDQRLSIEDCVLDGPCGLKLLAAASGREDLARGDEDLRARLMAGLAGLAGQYEYLIGDCPAGIGPDVMAWAAVADHVLVVTTPDPAAVTDAYGTIKALASWSESNAREIATPEWFLNQVSGVREATQVAQRLSEVCQRFLARSPRLAGWLPRSNAVAHSARSQSPFALRPGAALESHCLAQIAARILFRFKSAPNSCERVSAISRSGVA